MYKHDFGFKIEMNSKMKDSLFYYYKYLSTMNGQNIGAAA